MLKYEAMATAVLKGKKILIISPHPDDEAICCGGLIMLAKKQKASVFVLYMAIGESRQFLTGQTNTKSRIREIAKAAKFGNFEYSIFFKGKQFMRLDIVPQKALIEIIEDTTKKIKPDIVIIPFRHSFDQDHRSVATAAITAYRPLPSNLLHQPSIILESEEPYSWTTLLPFTPNVFLNITYVFDKKIKLIAKHKTQLRKDPFPRSSNNLKRLAGMRGCEISVKYAEAYNLLRGQIL